jgi:AraC-like DNA-binding protein
VISGQLTVISNTESGVNLVTFTEHAGDMVKIREENEYYVRWSSTKYWEIKHSLAFEPRLNGTYLVEAKINKDYIEHSHSDFEIISPISNHYQCVLNKKSVNVPLGSLILIQPGDIHKDIFFEGLKYLAFSFDLQPTLSIDERQTLFKPNEFPGSRVVRYDFDDVNSTLLRLMSAGRHTDEVFGYHVLNDLFKAFFWNIIRLFSQNTLHPFFTKSVKNEEFKNALFDFFETSLSENLSVKEIAEKLGMSESLLAHKAKKILGVSPAKALSNYKMSKAVRWLRKNNLSIKEISALLGFKDQFHFSKTFKKRFKKPPSSFR